MYSNMNPNITIDYNEDMLFKLKEMIKEGWEKLKTFVNSQPLQFKEESTLDFYYDLREKFKNISLKLKELKFCEELRYFLSISHLINYIVYKNSLDATFGHCCFAVDLLKFFIKIFKTNLQFYNNIPKDEDFQKIQEKFEKIHFEYIREFYWEIYEPNDDYKKNRMYEMAKTLRR